MYRPFWSAEAVSKLIISLPVTVTMSVLASPRPVFADTFRLPVILVSLPVGAIVRSPPELTVKLE